MKAGILGYGEVGRAVAAVIEENTGDKPAIKDLDRDDGLSGRAVLHVCIPWSDSFVETVTREILASSAALVIIHSTVPPGTTRAVQDAMRRQRPTTVVHSPVRGIHPNLARGIKTFVKFVGADSQVAGQIARQHLTDDMGLVVRVLPSSDATEMLKIMSTTYYGVCIAYHGEMGRACDRLGVNFDAVKDWNETYNEGYARLGCAHFRRPVLYPPPPDGIGGHCVCQNTVLFRRFAPSRMFRWLDRYCQQTAGEARRLTQGTPCIWLTGLPCSGKTTLADALAPKLEAAGHAPYRLDGDVIRQGLSCDLGFSASDRRENLRRTAYACSMLCDNGILPVASFISPSESVRGMVEDIVGADRFFLVHIDCPAETCELRDVKGMWAKARQGEIKAFTGIDDPYESPVDPDITVETDGPDVEYCVASIMDAFEGKIR